MAFFFLQIQDQTRLAHSQWLCILNATVNVRTNLVIISCTSTYGVLLCVKFNKKILWTVLKGYKVNGRAGAGAGIFVRTDFFFGKNQSKKLKKKSPPLPPITFVSSRVMVVV